MSLGLPRLARQLLRPQCRNRRRLFRQNSRGHYPHFSMGFRHKSLPIHSVQFHPESIATEHGHAMLANFLRICGLDPHPLPA